MRISKTLGTILYALYGPNGSDQYVHSGQSQLLNVYGELKSHGLVELSKKDHNGMIHITRTMIMLHAVKGVRN